MAIWLKNNKIVIDENGHVVLCDECPCEKKVESYLFVNVVEACEYYANDQYVYFGSNSNGGEKVFSLHSSTDKSNSIITIFSIPRFDIDGNNYLKEFLMPVMNNSYSVYQLRLNNDKMHKSGNTNYRYIFLVSGNVNNTSVYTPYPINNNESMVTVTSENIEPYSLSVKTYNSNNGDWEAATIETDRYIDIFKVNEYNIDNGWNGKWTVVDKQLTGNLYYFVLRIITGTTDGWCLEDSDSGSDPWDCGLISTQNNVSSICVVFHPSSEFFSQLHVYPAISPSPNRYNFLKNNVVISCYYDTIIPNKLVSTTFWSRGNYRISAYTSSYYNNILTPLTENGVNDPTLITTGRVTCDNNDYIIRGYKYNWNVSPLSTKYTLLHFHFYDYITKYDKDYKLSAYDHVNSTWVTLHNKTVSHSSTGTTCNGLQLSGNMYLIHNLSGELYWNKDYPFLPPYTSAMINGVKTEITNGLLTPVTDIETRYFVCNNGDDSTTTLSLTEGQQLYRQIDYRAEILNLLPSCYWNPSIAGYYTNQKLSTIIDPNTDTTVRELKSSPTITYLCNGYTIVNPGLIQYKDENNELFRPLSTYNKFSYDWINSILPPHTSAYVKSGNTSVLTDITGEEPGHLTFSGTCEVKALEGNGTETVTLTQNSILFPREGTYFICSSTGRTFTLRRRKPYKHNRRNNISKWDLCSLIKTDTGLGLSYNDGNYTCEISSGWFGNYSDMTNCLLIYDSDLGCWKAPTMQNSNYITLTGGTSTTPPPFFYYNKSQYNIFSSLYYREHYYNDILLVRKSIFDAEYGIDLGYIGALKNIEGTYKRPDIKNKLILTRFKGIQNLRVQYANVAYCGADIIDHLVDRDNGVYHNVPLSDIKNFSIVGSGVKDISDIFTYPYYFSTNSYVDIDNEGDNNHTLIKFHLNPGENLTKNYTGVYCLILTSCYVFSGADDTYKDVTEGGSRQYGILTGVLKLDTYYSFGPNLWNLRIWNDISFVTTAFGKANLNDITAGDIYNLMTALSDGYQFEFLTFAFIYPIRLYSGTVVDNNFDKFIVPSSIVYAISDYSLHYGSNA